MALDVEGSLGKFAAKLGGKVITPSNESGRINVLELRPMFSAKFEDDPDKPKDEKSIIAANYTEEISRVMCFFYQMLPEMDDTMANLLNDILRTTYRKKGITNLTRLDGMSAEDFPVMSDLLSTIRDELYVSDDKSGDKVFRASLSDLKKNILERLEIAVKPLAEGSYATIFNGFSTVDVSKEEFVVFDVSMLAEMESKVFNAALLNIMALMWGEVYNNRVLNEGRGYEDYRYCICEWDEAHRFINTNNPKGLEFMDKLVRRDRKYSAGLWFASQIKLKISFHLFSIKSSCSRTPQTMTSSKICFRISHVQRLKAPHIFQRAIALFLSEAVKRFAATVTFPMKILNISAAENNEKAKEEKVKETAETQNYFNCDCGFGSFFCRCICYRSYFGGI
jgi:hypothetical protein